MRTSMDAKAHLPGRAPSDVSSAARAGVDVSHKAKGKLSALELAKKRKRERAGGIIAALLAEADPTAQAVSLRAPCPPAQKLALSARMPVRACTLVVADAHAWEIAPRGGRARRTADA